MQDRCPNHVSRSSMFLTLQPITFFHKGFENSKQLQSFHVVFGRACGAALTTSNTLSKATAKRRCNHVKWHAAMKEHMSIIQIKVPNCIHKTFLTKNIPKHQIAHNRWIVPCTSKHLTLTSCGLRPRLRRCLDHVQNWLRKATANCNAMLQPI